MSESNPKVRLIGEPQSVPVFNCRVIVSRDRGGKFVARAAELADLSASGDSQREALQKLVAAFKAQMASYVSANQEIPWTKPGQQVQPGETELFVAVHL
jgi:predicted RNase H-like HicB family nuclease